MKNVIFIFLILIAYNIKAQPPIQWKKCYGGSARDWSGSIQQTKDGGYITVGFTESNDGDVTVNHGIIDYWLVKVDSLGVIIWEKSYGGTNDDEACYVQQTIDGGYVVAGLSNSDDGDVNGHHGSINYCDIWIIKVDSLGTLLWQLSLGGSSYDLACSIKETSDSGFIISGVTQSNDGDVTVNYGKSDYWVIKLNSSGILQWQKTYGGSDDDRPGLIQQTFDGGYIVAGWTHSNVIGFHGVSDSWILKLDSLGNIQWQKAFGGSSVDGAYSIQQTYDNCYIVGGTSNSIDGDLIGHNASYRTDIWIIKLDTLGNIIMKRTFGSLSDDAEITLIEQCTDHGYIVGGSSRANNGDVTGNHGYFDYWVLKLDSFGNKQWQKSLGGSFYDAITDVHQTADGGYIVSGRAQSNNGDVTGTHGNYEIWLIKFLGSVTTLPIELLSFNATINSKKAVDITWSTASEINNDYFTIERSSDAINFEHLNNIDGAGNSTVVQEYYFVDEKPLPDISYYRLKQTDFDGSCKYFDPVAVKNPATKDFNVYPNPSDGNKIHISISGNQKDELLILIYDINGREIFSKNIFIPDKENTFILSPQNKLPPGIYMIQLKNDVEIKQRSFVVN